MPKSNGRRVVGVSGSAYLVLIEHVDDPKRAIAVVVDHGELKGGSAPLQSFLARGPWEPWDGSADEATAILATLPASIPTAVPLPPGAR
jgi:hypothetical protein